MSQAGRKSMSIAYMRHPLKVYVNTTTQILSNNEALATQK